VLGRPDWATDPKFAKSAQRVAHKTELLPMIAAALKQKPRAHWVETMEKAGVPCSPVNDIGEVARSEQFAASKLAQQLPGGPKVVGLPIAFDHVRPTSPRSAPTLGEHTEEVLGALDARS
jgi:crotonobetainyl-CoA:carnitine CoA-transferase CaiB-like acyl-CoA transferase